MNGLRYRVSRRSARDSRLQEQLEQRTALEMEQAVFRCRPHNLSAPEQGHLFKGQTGRRRMNLDIYVFGQTPLGMPVHVVTERAARKAALLDQVVVAAGKLVKSGRSVTQRGLEAALRAEGLAVTYRGVIEALRWLRREHGEDWLEVLWVEESPPRAGLQKDTEEPLGPLSACCFEAERGPADASEELQFRRDSASGSRSSLQEGLTETVPDEPFLLKAKVLYENVSARANS